MQGTSPENRTAGILWMLATIFCFIALDAVMKYLMDDYSLVQVTWARFFFATVAVFIICARRLPELAISRTPGLQSLRSILLMTTTGLFNAGIKTTPLATATTIMFLGPLFVTMLSIPMLGEKVGVRRWSGVMIGLLGALVVVRPWESGLGATGTGMLFLLAAAFTNANYQILTRKVRADDPLTSLLFTATAGAIVTSCMVPWFWTWPTAKGWLLFAASGLFGGLGHYCLIHSLKAAPASVVAPFNYSSILWATLFGLVIWQEFPDGWTWAGAVLIIASGLYVFHRERVTHAQR